MPTLRNKSSNVKFIRTEQLYPGEEKAMMFYPDPDDDDVEIVSHEPIYRMGMTAPCITSAITNVKVVTVPKGTRNIEIGNYSSGIIKYYNYERGDTAAPGFVDWGVPIPPNNIKILDDIGNRIWQFELHGTAAENEVIITFLS